MKIPVINWLLGGTLSTLHSIMRLQRPQEVRTVVFQGTGQAADVIAGAQLNHYGEQYRSSKGLEQQGYGSEYYCKEVHSGFHLLFV